MDKCVERTETYYSQYQRDKNVNMKTKGKKFGWKFKCESIMNGVFSVTYLVPRSV